MTTREPHSLVERVYAYLKEQAPEPMSRADLLEVFPEVPPHTLSALLPNLLKDRHRQGVVRVSSGTYAYRPGEVSVPASTGANGGKRTKTPAAAAHTDEALRPIGESVTAEGFMEAGLTPVARTLEGGWLCTDEQGTPWVVSVTVTARRL
jgi:hypothetical protein